MKLKSSYLMNRFLLLIIFLLISCGKGQNKYYIAVGSEGASYYDVGMKIAEIVTNQGNFELAVLPYSEYKTGKTSYHSSLDNCCLLSEKKADFAISQNDVPIDKANGDLQFSNLRSVVPLYLEIFFLIYKESLNPESLEDLIVGKTVLMGPEDSGTTQLTKSLFKGFGIDESNYIPRYVELKDIMLSDSIDICCLVTGFNNYRITKSLERGGKIFSLGDWSLVGKGSAVEGFCLKYPMAKPYIIPKKLFFDLPEDPVLTVAIDAILMTREDIDSDVIYDFLELILNNKQFIVFDLDNKLLSQLTEKFDPLKLRFPLHDGAKRYLDREKPTFLERYADSLAFFLSIFLTLIAGGAYLYQWNKQRKKNRIDVFYQNIIKIQKQVEKFQKEESCLKAIKELKNLREEAFEQLIDEKLSADESFRIFITFLQDTQTEIDQRIQQIEKLEGR